MPDQPKPSKHLLNLLAIVFAVIALLLFYLIFALWPINHALDLKTNIFGLKVSLPQESQYFLLVVFTGALGGIISVMISYTAFVGNQTFAPSWITWYLLRPLIAAGLAVTFYMLLRGGILSYNTPTDSQQQTQASTNTGQYDQKRKTDSLAKLDSTVKAIKAGHITDTVKADTNVYAVTLVKKQMEGYPAEQTEKTTSPSTPVPLNPFGIMSVALLAGLFSKYASEKLEEVFKTMFNVKEKPVFRDDLQGGKGNTPSTSATSTTPADDDIADILTDPDTDTQNGGDNTVTG